MNDHYWVKVELANIVNQYGGRFEISPSTGGDTIIIELQ